jgi:uncharacterized protein
MNTWPRLLIGSPADPAENNCACPVADMQSYGLLVSMGLWRSTSLYHARLDSEHELVLSPRSEAAVVVLNRAAVTVLDAFAIPRALHELDFPGIEPRAAAATMERFVAHGLLEPEGGYQSDAPAQPSTLTAWLHVTNACNLACTYCYVDKSAAVMSAETGYAAVDAIIRSATQHGFSAIKLKYAGGEATLNFTLVQKLHAYALAQTARAGLALHGVVLSNGVALTRAMICWLHEANLRLMISLDGLGAAHDQHRVFRNGRGSFVSVSHSIERALAAGLQPDLSITVTGQSAQDLPAVVEFALERDLLFNLNFYRDTKLASSPAQLRAEEVRLIAGVRDALAVISGSLPRRRLIDGMLDRSAFNQAHEHACGAGIAYLVVDQAGGIARCQMELDQTVTTVADRDPLKTIWLTPGSFRNLATREKEGCRTCTWRQWCAGGCPKLTREVTGRDNIRSPYCEVYKAIYPDLVRLEGMRLLKWAAVETAHNAIEYRV